VVLREAFRVVLILAVMAVVLQVWCWGATGETG
jgi:hypothetical protein